MRPLCNIAILWRQYTALLGTYATLTSLLVALLLSLVGTFNKSCLSSLRVVELRWLGPVCRDLFYRGISKFFTFIKICASIPMLKLRLTLQSGSLMLAIASTLMKRSMFFCQISSSAERTLFPPSLMPFILTLTL